jgi:hypothetical protein
VVVHETLNSIRKAIKREREREREQTQRDDTAGFREATGSEKEGTLTLGLCVSPTMPPWIHCSCSLVLEGPLFFPQVGLSCSYRTRFHVCI